MEKRVKLEIKFPKEERCFCDLSTGEPKFYRNEDMIEEISNKGGHVIEVLIPKEIKSFEVRKAHLSPIVDISYNRVVWPKDEAIGLMLYLNNREINMICDGEFRQNKYKSIFNAISYKPWALIQYKYMDGHTRNILWWKIWN